MENIVYRWREVFDNAAVNRLHAEAFAHPVLEDDWWRQVNHYSLGWVCARDAGALVGFVNVAWDGGVHAFILDTMVANGHRHRGIATRMLEICVAEARHGRCEWLHADYEEELAPFYLEACGFRATPAGLVRL
jgi:ribosomal protein S18 acetylase RimI-like enzyme